MDLNSTNVTVTSSHRHEGQEYKIVLYCILLVWSLVGNILVVAVIVYNQNLRTSFNYLVLNMTTSDLLCPLVSLPLRIYIETGAKTWPTGNLGDILCKVCYFLTDISPTVSVFTLVVAAFERFNATVYSNRVYIINKRKTMIFIVFTWMLATSIYTSYLYGYRRNSLLNSCKLDLKPKYHIILHIIILVSMFVIPFISITTLYTTMIYKLHQASKEITHMLDSRLARSRHRRNRHIFCLSIIIIAAFVVFWGPFYAFLFVWSVVWQHKVPIYVDRVNLDKAAFVVDVLGLANSCINPCIYFSFQKNYRQGLTKIWRHLVERRFTATNHDQKHLNTSSRHAQRHPTRSTKLASTAQL